MDKKEPGYVYILTNPSFREDWVKIGKSSRPVDQRYVWGRDSPPKLGGESEADQTTPAPPARLAACYRRDARTQEGKAAPIIINSGYRSPQLNKIVGGSPTSNHLTGCAVDIKVYGIEQAMRYAVILMDYADETKQDYDELLIERNKGGGYWLHFAVRPKDNRRKTKFLPL